MTLLGKIFRPWDLACNESIESKSSESSNSSQNSVQLQLNDEHKESSTSSGKSASEKFRARLKESSRSGHRNQSSGLNALKVEDSNGSVVVPQLLDINQSNISYFLPSSPATPNSTSFMSPTSINELATLSRSELTAIGLLPPEPPASMKVKRQRPKRFRCPHCQVAFSNNGQLRGHIRIHTGERPFACEHEGCGKSFTRNEELTRHRRIHTGLRPYPCTHCGKKFGRKDHLKKHTRTHQRPIYSASSGMIGLGNPFHPFNPSLIPSHAAITDFGSVTSPYALPFMLSIPPPISHFPFS